MKRPDITPGDWRQNKVAVQHDIHDVLDQQEATVAFIPANGRYREADGKAIAAVPNLLESLADTYTALDALWRMQMGNTQNDTLDAAKAALIKAGYTF